MRTRWVIVRSKALQTDQTQTQIEHVESVQTIPNKNREPWHTKQTCVFVGECLIGRASGIYCNC